MCSLFKEALSAMFFVNIWRRTWNFCRSEVGDFPNENPTSNFDWKAAQRVTGDT